MAVKKFLVCNLQACCEVPALVKHPAPSGSSIFGGVQTATWYLIKVRIFYDWAGHPPSRAAFCEYFLKSGFNAQHDQLHESTIPVIFNFGKF